MLKMKKTMNLAAAVAALCSASLAGCIEDGNETTSPVERKAIRFSTTIHTTRAYNSVWEPGDRIGVYMLPAQAALSAEAGPGESGSIPLAENKLYTHGSGNESESVVFAGIDEENTICWPGGGKAVDFTAYYPWRPSDEIPNSVYPVDLTDQSVQQKIDLMYSANVEGVSEGNPALMFEHKLTGLVFNVTDRDGTSLEGMTASIEGLPSKAGFDLVTGGIIPASESAAEPFDALLFSTSDGDPADSADDDGTRESAVVKAIVLPGEGLDYSVAFTLASGDRAVFSLENVEYKSGKRYIYDIVLSSKPGEKVGFGASGELSSIVGWEDVKDNEPHDITKNDDGTDPPRDGETGAPWSSGVLVSNPDGSKYSVTGNAREASDGSGLELTMGNPIGVIKTNYEGGIASVTVYMKVNSSTSVVIRSVKAGGVDLVYEDGRKEVTISETLSTETPFVFTVGEEKPVSGTVEINVETTRGKASISRFDIN